MSRIKRVVRHWMDVDGTVLSASVTFFAALALFPVVVVLLSLFGWALANSENVQQWRGQVLDLISDRTSADFSEIVASQLALIESSTRLTGVVGFLSLFAFSMAFFSNLERAFARIWELPRERFGVVSRIKRILYDRIRAYLMILLLILVTIMNFVFNIYLENLWENVVNADESSLASWTVRVSAEVALNGLLFTGVFQIMTREKISWRNAIYGGFLTAILWQPGRYLIATYLISDRYTAFGIVGSFWVVLFWMYYGISVVLFGATVVYVAEKERR